MNNLDTIIDFGSKNLRLGVFNQSSEKVYSSNIKINEVLENNNLDNALKNLVRDAEKQLSTHLADVNILYDSSEFNFIDFSIKKSFDQPTLISKHYKSLIEEANFIISENNFRDQVIHIDINNIIVDENRKLENLFDDIKIKSLILEIKFICLKKSTINNLSNKFKKNNLNILCIYCSSYVKSFFYKKSIDTRKNIIFLDIGYETTSALFFNNNKFQFLNSVPIGGNNITKDISKVLKLDISYSEDLKTKFDKNENEISFNKISTNDINLFSEISEKNISIDLLKQVIQARVDEIINISIIQNNYFKNINSSEKPKIIFIGNGSKLISFINNFNLKNSFSELIFFDESDTKICEAGINYHKSDERSLINIEKKLKKTGFFEKFFNLFSR
tara:strand:- start:2240 stop:3406 length:1167 start_codon:yes stop_codon:yes gene_type:complete